MDRIQRWFGNWLQEIRDFVSPPSNTPDHIGDVSDPNGVLAAQEAALRDVVNGGGRDPQSLAVENALDIAHSRPQPDLNHCERIDLRNGNFGRLCPILGRPNAWLFFNP